MQIVVNHLTRMQEGFICVAGVDRQTGRHVRPVGQQPLAVTLLARNGGPFDMAAVVDLGRTKPVGAPPEQEDHLFDPKSARRLGDLSADEFWSLLAGLAKPSLTEIFGLVLTARGPRSCALDLGCGNASLGCLKASHPHLSIRSIQGRRSQVRLELHDSQFHVDLGVTDIRLYGPDHLTPDAEKVREVATRLQGTREVILSVGLTRAFSSSSNLPPVHWLQVNNIHLPDNPAWQLA
jgi:hypothetical protein